MTHPPEQLLEDNLVKQLKALGHSFIQLNNEADILANLKVQLEKHNNSKKTLIRLIKLLIYYHHLGMMRVL